MGMCVCEYMSITSHKFTSFAYNEEQMTVKLKDRSTQGQSKSRTVQLNDSPTEGIVQLKDSQGQSNLRTVLLKEQSKSRQLN